MLVCRAGFNSSLSTNYAVESEHIIHKSYIQYSYSVQYILLLLILIFLVQNILGLVILRAILNHLIVLTYQSRTRYCGNGNHKIHKLVAPSLHPNLLV